MRKVVIGINAKGEPYIVSKPTKVEVEFKKDKRKSWKKRMRTFWYQIKTMVGGA